MDKKYWLMKSEPRSKAQSRLQRGRPDEGLSIEDLKECGVAPWTGVRNYEARNFMRDQMAVGDLIIFYHSSATPTGAAGIARVSSPPYPDHTQFEKHSKYFDPKATREAPRWFMVDVAFVKQFKHFITREELKSIRELKGVKLWTHLRLSIIPLDKAAFDTIVKRAGKRIDP